MQRTSNENSNRSQGIKTLKDALLNFNEYTIFQVLWLAEIYYLALNLLLGSLNFISNFLNISLQENLPPLLFYYNAKIMEQIVLYSDTVRNLSIGFFISSIAFSPFKKIFLENYELIYKGTEYGFYAGGWMLLIWCTYEVYRICKLVYFFVPLLLMILHEVYAHIRKQNKM